MHTQEQEPERPDYPAVAKAWKTIERDARHRTCGGGTSWRDNVAYELARQEVRAVVLQVIDDCRHAVETAQVTTRDGLDRYLNESVDGMLVYTVSALVYLLGSDNSDAGPQELGDQDMTPEAAAMYALLQDVQESGEWAALVEKLEEDAD